MLFKLCKNIAAGAVYIVCLWSILATSQAQKSFSWANLHVTSDCDLKKEMDVKTATDQIAEPSGVKWSDFGFPSDSVDITNDISGTVSGVDRLCTRTYGDTISSTDWAYTCFDNGAYKCTIVIHQN